MDRPTKSSATNEMPTPIETEVALAGVTTPVSATPSASGHLGESDLLAVLAMRAMRAALNGAIAQRTEEIERLSTSRNYLDEVLHMFELNDLKNGPAPAWCRPSGTNYLAYGEMRRRCLDAMRGGAVITAREIVDALMPDKGLDPVKDKELRSDLIKRALRALATLGAEGRVEKIGHGIGVRWRLVAAKSAQMPVTADKAVKKQRKGSVSNDIAA